MNQLLFYLGVGGVKYQEVDRKWTGSQVVRETLNYTETTALTVGW